MARLNYLTNLMPYNWHLNRILKKYGRENELLDVDRKRVQGSLGECNVIAWINSNSQFHDVIFNNVLVPTAHSSTGNIELDILWLSNEGLTIVEVKTLSGIIETHSHGQWKQVFDNHSVQLSSPVEQCFSQIKALKKHLKDCDIKIPVRGLVALANQNKVRMLDVQRLPIVCNQFELKDQTDKFKQLGNATPKQINDAFKLIQTFDRN